MGQVIVWSEHGALTVEDTLLDVLVTVEHLGPT